MSKGQETKGEERTMSKGQETKETAVIIAGWKDFYNKVFTDAQRRRFDEYMETVGSRIAAPGTTTDKEIRDMAALIIATYG